MLQPLVKRPLLLLYFSVLAGSCTTEPASIPARGSAHIAFDQSSQNVTGVYFEGDTTIFELKTSFPSPPSPASGITVLVLDSSRGGRYDFGPGANTILSFSTYSTPFTYSSDSGSAIITYFAGDTLIGSLSVRLIGSDSGMHHLSMSFIASSPFPID